MKWLISFLLVLFMASAAFAGEAPYIAIVGNDCVDTTQSFDPAEPCVANPFYFSEKHQQFLYDQTQETLQGELVFPPVCFGNFPPANPAPPICTRVGDDGCEQFRFCGLLSKKEVCDTQASRGEKNGLIPANAGGRFEWWIRLPMRPQGEINICIQCGILKPEEDDVMECAAETGELVQGCTRRRTGPGVSPIKIAGLPKLEVVAWPGPYTDTVWKEFHLTAYKNPSDYGYTLVPNQTPKQIKDGLSLQVLDGKDSSRVLLKSCMDKCVIAKIPVENLRNSMGEIEHDLAAGDLIQVKLQFSNNNTVDVYCHSQSAKIMGIGEPPF